MPRLSMLHVLGDSKFGGDSVMVVALGRAAQQMDLDVDVLATHDVFQEVICENGLGLVDLDVIRRPIRPVWEGRGILRLARFLRESSYSLVHTHTSKAGFVGRLASRLAGIPAVVHTVHGFAFHEQSSLLSQTAYSTLERVAARFCDRIITVSEHHRERAIQLGIGKADQVVAIPNGTCLNGIEPTGPRASVRARLGLHPDEFVLLSTGRLAEQKGLEYLIRAMPLCRESIDPTKVLLAGEGPLRQHLERLAVEQRVGDLVQFLGMRDDIADLLHACDLVVLPSLWEGMSISLLEAMAAGKPIITTTIASNLEVTRNGEGALLVPPKAPVELAAAIQTVATNPTCRKRLANRAKEIQREHYTMERMVEAYMKQYQDLFRRKGLETRS